ncbi:MAG TPA: hypothetical protein VKN99_13465 [Polyangia bacterium]|nr:hypothetical protein [Polyangia bacterium]
MRQLSFALVFALAVAGPSGALAKSKRSHGAHKRAHATKRVKASKRGAPRRSREFVPTSSSSGTLAASERASAPSPAAIRAPAARPPAAASTPAAMPTPAAAPAPASPERSGSGSSDYVPAYQPRAVSAHEQSSSSTQAVDDEKPRNRK